MMSLFHVVFDRLKWAVDKVIAPLRAEETPNAFRLSSPETHTTTIDGATGWGNRPPARLRCRRCDSIVDQRDPLDDIDCPHCVASSSHEEFPDHELELFVCPVCGDQMEHGTRHPHALDIPEWATCHNCRFHWEFKHSY